MNAPLVLDFDASVQPLAPDERRIPLADWQERIRFGCARSALDDLERHLAPRLAEHPGPVFTGSGDFHHLSALLLKRSAAAKALDLLVCDNHPDNMRYPFGIHCGSWVAHAARMPHVRRIHVIGISSRDIALPHAWENRLSPLLSGKLMYWSVGVSAAWLKLPGLRGRHRNFASAGELVDAFLPVLDTLGPVYLSLDKDVLSKEVVRTRWDQGSFSAPHLERICRACSGKLAGADICGEISDYRYKGLFKRLLVRLDGQGHDEGIDLRAEQLRHRELNLKILDWLR